MGGRVVQLVQGEDLALGFDDLDYWIDRFAAYPLVQLIDLDAAKRQGDNRALIRYIVQRIPCQVGGGLRNVDDARELLDLGARRVIFGSSLFQSNVDPSNSADISTLVRRQFAEHLAKSLSTEHLVFSVDSKGDKVAVRGWQQQIALQPETAMRELESFCGGFLYTHVDTEGTMSGFPMKVAQKLRSSTERQLIVAGGIRSQAEIAELDAMHVDAVAGMAIYTGAMHA